MFYHDCIFRFNLSEGFQLDTIVEKCPFTLTGADFYALSSDAMLNAVKQKIQELDSGNNLFTLDAKMLNFAILNKLSPLFFSYNQIT